MTRLPWTGEPVAPRPVHRTTVDPATGLRLTMLSTDGVRWSGNVHGLLVTGPHAGMPIRATAWVSESAQRSVCESIELLEGFLVQTAAELRAIGWEPEDPSS